MMRVYEFSKQLGISNKELLELLKGEGLDITTHMGQVPASAIEKITKKLQNKSKAEESMPKEPIMQQTQSPQNPKNQPEVASQVRVEPKRVPEEKKEAEITIVVAPMTLAEFALRARKPMSEVITSLLKQGTLAVKNQMLTENVVTQLAHTYNLKIIAKSTAETPAAKEAHKEVITGDMHERMPVVVVIGHVDHGKTTLLDYIRKTRVAAKEKGGITQHLGAYEAKTDHGTVVFLDTPGHEAFSKMRVRGLKVADIAILMIAGDDGVMPQTVEAIKRAKEAGTSIIVAINKVDKATPGQLEVVKRQLAQHDLAPEDWGGSTVCVPISAKTGQGVNELLEVVLLQSQIMELKASLTVPAQGFILESKIEKGRGPVATVICQNGVLKVGDFFIAGAISGKVNSLVDSHGKRVTSVGPSQPALVAGFNGLAQAGDIFRVVTQQETKNMQPTEEIKMSHLRMQTAGKESFNIIVKTDNASSHEALLNALAKLSAKAAKPIVVVSSGIGSINESDLQLAQDTDSMLYSFHVKVDQQLMPLAARAGVVIKHFDIIYKLLEDVEASVEKEKPIKMVSKKVGEAIVLKVFDIKNLGIVAGAQIKSGRFVKEGKVLIWRGKNKVGEGDIKSLQRDRKAVKEVHSGFECAFMVDDFDEWQPDDRVECFVEMPAV